MAKSSIVSKTEDFRSGYLSLPFDQDQFKDFITGLLGRPQSINRKIYGEFDLQLKDIQNFHELLNQRITQQNNGYLIQLQTTIEFDDNSTVTLGSIEELLTYHEVKPIVSTGVQMNWTYLIQFQGQEAPQKQEIEIAYTTTSTSKYLESRPRISITVDHTARTWGTDIESLLVNQCQTTLRRTSQFELFLQRHSGRIAWTVGLLFFLFTIFGIYNHNVNLNSQELESAKKIIVNAKATVEDKMDYLMTYLVRINNASLYTINILYVIGSIICSIVLASWTSDLASTEQNSYVTLTQASVSYRQEMEKIRKRATLWFIISIIVSITTGIVSNVIYLWLIER